MSVNRSQGKIKDIDLGDYLIKNTIGQGTFGKVKLGINKLCNTKVAIKILEASKIIEKDDQERVDRELKIIQEFNHPNVVLVTDIYKSSNNFFIVMEYCEGGELFNYIVKKRRLSEEEASFFFYQIINGLEYIHSHNVVHRDLKPENLLLTKDYLLKIIDFGLSNFFHKKLLSTPCGSPCYASPEMVSGKKYNGFRIDIWSTGIILYAMVCGYLPFEDQDNDVLFKKILECKLVFPRHVSSIVKDLMLKILVTDHHKRITLPEIKRHPFFLQGKSLFEAKFEYKKEASNIQSLEEEDFVYQVNKTEGCEMSKVEKNSLIHREKTKEIKKNKNKSKEKRHHGNIHSAFSLDERYSNTMHVNSDSIKPGLKSVKKEEKVDILNANTAPNNPANQSSSKKPICLKSPKNKNAPVKPKTHLNITSIRGLHSMRFPFNTNIFEKKTQTPTHTPTHKKTKIYHHPQQTRDHHNSVSASKPITQKINSITINHAAININMIDPNILLDNHTNKTPSNHKASNSVSVGKRTASCNPMRNTERKNPALKFYNLFKQNPPSKNSQTVNAIIPHGQGYTGLVAKTQENKPSKKKLTDTITKNENSTNRKHLSSVLHGYQPIYTTGNKITNRKDKHCKINSLKLNEFQLFKKTPTFGKSVNSYANTNNNISFNQRKKDFDKTLAYLRSHFKTLCYKDIVSKLK